MKDMVALTEQILNSQDLLKKGRPGDAQPKPRQAVDIRMLFQRAETLTGKLKDNRIRTGVLLLQIKKDCF